MPQSDEAIRRAQRALRQLRDVNGRGDLIDGIGSFFPHGSSWLTSDGDPDFTGAFGVEEGVGGWLDAGQYTEFWGGVPEYTQDENPDLAPLAGLLERLLTGWETALREQLAARAADDDYDERRFGAIEPVTETPGWWRCVDVSDGGWRYVRSDTTPTDRTPGWMTYWAYAAAVAEDGTGASNNTSAAGTSSASAPSQGGPRYAPIVLDSDYPRWWRGFDTRDSEWRYVRSDAVPTDHTEGWMSHAAYWSAITQPAEQPADPPTVLRPDPSDPRDRRDRRSRADRGRA